MNYIVVLRGGSGLIGRQIEARLRNAGYDVCAIPRAKAGDHLHSSVGHALISSSAFVVALWTRADLSDDGYLDALTTAAGRSRLVGVSVDGTPAPAIVERLGGLTTPCSVEAVFAAASALAAPSGAQLVAREYDAFRRAQQQAKPRTWRTFARQHPNGLLHELALAEATFSEAPDYTPHSRELERGTAWRLQSPTSTAITAGAVVVLIGSIVLAQQSGLFQPVALAPREARAANGEEAIVGASAEAALEPTAPIAAPALEPIDLAALEAVRQHELRPRFVDLESAPSLEEDAPRRDPEITAAPSVQTASAAPSHAPAAARRAPSPAGFDAARIEPSLRTVVEQARRRQAYARGVASRSGGAGLHEADTRYAGEVVDGMADGLGSATWSDGARYEGSWRRSRPDGMGVMQLASGARYEGEFDGGRPTGRGVFWREDGARLRDGALFQALVSVQARSAPRQDTRSAR